MDTQVSIRIAENETDIAQIYRAFVTMHGEGGIPGPLDPAKTLRKVMALVGDPDKIVIMAMQGDYLVGVLALASQCYWFNDEMFFEDKGFFVLPGHRNGEAFDALLEMARQIGDDTGRAVYITINNLSRKRGGRTKWERRGATLGYHPQGAIIAHSPGE